MQKTIVFSEIIFLPPNFFKHILLLFLYIFKNLCLRSRLRIFQKHKKERLSSIERQFS